MDAFTNYLEKLGSNFLVSSMVPSLAFVVTSLLVFDPGLKILSSFQQMDDIPRLIVLGLLVSMMTVILGFTLTALNTFILKMFEGYVIPAPIQFLYDKSRRIHRERAQSQRRHRDILEEKLRALKKIVKSNPAREQEFEELKALHYKAAANYGLVYPDDPNDIMPSRFGNTLKAAESYPGERYGFDGVQFWPRLVHVIPTEYKLSIDGTRNELSFLVNMSVLSILFSLSCVAAIFFSMGAVNGVGTNPGVFIDFLWVVFRFLALAALGFISCIFFYNASIFSVGSFSLMIRSSFDLFRLDLLKKLGLKRPKDSIEEFDMWDNLNELVALGEHSVTYHNLEYREENEK